MRMVSQRSVGKHVERSVAVLLAAFLLAGTILTPLAAAGPAKDVRGDAKDARGDAKDGAQETREDSKDKRGETKEGAKETSHETRDQAKEDRAEAKDEAGDNAETAKDDADEAAKEGDEIKEEGEEGGERAQEKAEQEVRELLLELSRIDVHGALTVCAEIYLTIPVKNVGDLVAEDGIVQWDIDSALHPGPYRFQGLQVGGTLEARSEQLSLTKGRHSIHAELDATATLPDGTDVTFHADLAVEVQIGDCPTPPVRELFYEYNAVHQPLPVVVYAGAFETQKTYAAVSAVAACASDAGNLLVIPRGGLVASAVVPCAKGVTMSTAASIWKPGTYDVYAVSGGLTTFHVKLYGTPV